MHNRCIVTGSVSFDEIMDFPALFVDYFQPDKLHQINVSFVLERLDKQLGGIATNVAYNIRLVSQTPIVLLAALGKDGQPLIEFLKSHKIDTSHMLVDSDLFTTTGKVITDKNDNQIWGYYHGAAIRGKEIALGKLANKDDFLILSSTHPEATLHFQAEAIKKKLAYMYDPGPTLTWIQKADLELGVMHSHWVIGNDYEIALMLKMLNSTKTVLLERGIKMITTLGERGVQYEDSKQNIFLPGYKTTKVKDPTGAGDAWRGGFIASLVENKSMTECLAAGNALASFAVEKYGTINHYPTRAEFEKRLRKLC